MTYDDAKRFLLNFGIVSVTSAVAKSITAPLDRIKLILQNQDSALQVIKGERLKYNGIIDCLLRLPKEQGVWSFWRGNGTNLLRYFPMQSLNFAFNDFFKRRMYENISHQTETGTIVIKFLAGGFAGMCATSILYPLEFCQTRIAVDIGADVIKSKTADDHIKREFDGLRDCIKKIRGTVGIKGLYGGYPVAVLGISLYRAIYFGLFDTVKSLWAREKISESQEATKPPLLVGLFLAQGVTCFAGICTYPIDTVARRIMLESGRPKELRLFTTYIGTFMDMYKKEGISTFYKGAFTNCIRGMSGALVLVFYDEIMHYTKWKEWISPCDNC